jgi:hypothetical protein
MGWRERWRLCATKKRIGIWVRDVRVVLRNTIFDLSACFFLWQRTVVRQYVGISTCSRCRTVPGTALRERYSTTHRTSHTRDSNGHIRPWCDVAIDGSPTSVTAFLSPSRKIHSISLLHVMEHCMGYTALTKIIKTAEGEELCIWLWIIVTMPLSIALGRGVSSRQPHSLMTRSWIFRGVSASFVGTMSLRELSWFWQGQKL